MTAKIIEARHRFRGVRHLEEAYRKAMQEYYERLKREQEKQNKKVEG